MHLVGGRFQHLDVVRSELEKGRHIVIVFRIPALRMRGVMQFAISSATVFMPDTSLSALLKPDTSFMTSVAVWLVAASVFTSRL